MPPMTTLIWSRNLFDHLLSVACMFVTVYNLEPADPILTNLNT